MAGFTGPIAELFVTLGMETTLFRTNLRTAKAELSAFAKGIGVDLANQRQRMAEIAALIGGDLPAATKKAQVMVAQLTAEFNKQSVAGVTAARQRLRNEAAVLQAQSKALLQGKLTSAGMKESGELALQAAALKQQASELTIQGSVKENQAVASTLILQKLRQEAAARELDIDRRVTAANKIQNEQRRQQELRRIAQEKERSAISRSLISGEAAHHKLMLSSMAGATQASVAAQIGFTKGAANQQLALQQVLAVAHRQSQVNMAAATKARAASDTAATLESVSIQRQAIRGLVLSSFLVAGRAGLVTGLIGVAGTTTVAVAATVLGLGAVIKKSADFDKALIQSTANIKGMTAALREGLSAAATSLSNQFPVSAAKIVESMEQIREAGLSAQQAIASWPAFVAFSVAANADLGESIKLLVAIQRGFKTEFNIRTEEDRLKNLELIAKTIVTASREGGQAPLELLQGLAAAASAADKTSNSFQQVVAALTVMGLKNIDASRSGEILGQIMQRLRDEAVQNQKAWDDLVPSLGKAGNTGKEFSDVMKELAKAIGTTDEATNAFNSVQLGLEARTSKFIAVLLKEGATIEEVVASFGNLTSIEDLAAERASNLSDQMTILGQRIANAARVTFGAALVGGLKSALEAIEITNKGLDELQEREFKALDRENRIQEALERRKEIIRREGGRLAVLRLNQDELIRGVIEQVDAELRLIAVTNALAEAEKTRAKIEGGEDPTLGAKDAEAAQRAADARRLDLFEKDFSAKRLKQASLIDQLEELNKIEERGSFNQIRLDRIRADLVEAQKANETKLAKDQLSVEERIAQRRVALILENESLQKRTLDQKQASLDAAAQRDIERERRNFSNDSASQESLAANELIILANTELKKQALRDAAAAKTAKAEQARILAMNKADDAIFRAQLKRDNTQAAIEARVEEAKALRHEDLLNQVDILREQSLEGRANKFTLVMARIDARTAKQIERQRIFYGDDEKNFAALQEAKTLLEEIGGQRRRQVINRIGDDLQSMFNRNIRSAESFQDAMANIFDELARSFEGAVFDMVAAWLTGQSDMVTASKQSGGFGGLFGLITKAIFGGFAPGAGAAASAPTAAVSKDFLNTDILKGLTLPVFDTGGLFRANQAFISGVPELILPGTSGSAVPLDRISGNTVNNFIDARGADVSVVQRITNALEEMQNQSVENAVITTKEMALRGF